MYCAGPRPGSFLCFESHRFRVAGFIGTRSAAEARDHNGSTGSSISKAFPQSGQKLTVASTRLGAAAAKAARGGRPRSQAYGARLTARSRPTPCRPLLPSGTLSPALPLSCLSPVFARLAPGQVLGKNNVLRVWYG